MMQTCLLFSNPFFEFCFLTPAFFPTILLHKFVQVFDTLKILVSNSSQLLWNQRYSEKGNLPDPFKHTFSFDMPFYMNLSRQNS